MTRPASGTLPMFGHVPPPPASSAQSRTRDMFDADGADDDAAYLDENGDHDGAAIARERARCIRDARRDGKRSWTW